MKKLYLLALAGLSVVASAAYADTNATQTITGTRLDVSVQGSVDRVPDIAIISAGVVTQSTDASAALRDDADKMARVIAALRAAGVAEKDMSTASISLSPQYRYDNGAPPKITGYQASNTLTIKFRDISKSGAILDTLVAQGANDVNGPSMSLEHPEAALDEARVNAMRQARARAELYASAAGLHVKRIVSIDEQGGQYFQPRPMMMAKAAPMAEAATQVLPGEQTLSISLNVVFELE